LANPSESGGGTKTAGAAERESTRDIVVKYVLRNKAIWALAFSYFFLYIVRQGMTSWGQFYIVDQKGVSSAAQAAATMSGLEIGGLFGGLCSGVLSDACNGFRMRVVVLYMVGLAVALAGLALAPSGDTRHLIAWLSAIGFFIYGPQMLIGLIGSEVSHPRVRTRAPFAEAAECVVRSVVGSVNEGCESRVSSCSANRRLLLVGSRRWAPGTGCWAG
jgi:sugar phosphate permease